MFLFRIVYYPINFQNFLELSATILYGNAIRCPLIRCPSYLILDHTVKDTCNPMSNSHSTHAPLKRVQSRPEHDPAVHSAEIALLHQIGTDYIAPHIAGDTKYRSVSCTPFMSVISAPQTPAAAGTARRREIEQSFRRFLVRCGLRAAHHHVPFQFGSDCVVLEVGVIAILNRLLDVSL